MWRSGLASLAGLLVFALMPAAAGETAPACFGVRATIIGTDGPDVLKGTIGPDVIVGLGGRDLIRGRGGDDRICAGPNPDLTTEDGYPLEEIAAGGPGDDRVSGGLGKDALDGGAGRDVLVGGVGDDILGGGPGSDRAYGGSGDDRWNGWGTAAEAERFFGGPGRDDAVAGSGADLLRGGPGPDHLVGGPGPDLLRGDGGKDILVGDEGDDRLVGGPGRDVVSHVEATCGGGCTGSTSRAVRVDLAAGVARGFGTDRLAGIEDAIGGGGDDVLLGDNGQNRLFAGARGNDYVNGRGGRDTFSYADICCGSEPGLRADLSDGTARQIGHFSGRTRLVSVENLRGSDQERDVLTGDRRDNVLTGLGGGDILDGGPGSDVLLGGMGDDDLDGGLGADRIMAAADDDILRGDIDDLADGGAGVDVCSGALNEPVGCELILGTVGSIISMPGTYLSVSVAAGITPAGAPSGYATASKEAQPEWKVSGSVSCYQRRGPGLSVLGFAIEESSGTDSRLPPANQGFVLAFQDAGLDKTIGPEDLVFADFSGSAPTDCSAVTVGDSSKAYIGDIRVLP